MQRGALFELLSQTPESVWLVTPNVRLARELGREHDALQLADGLDRWATPRIVSFATLVAELFDSIAHSPTASGVRYPLSVPQEQALWERALSESEHVLLAPAAAARLAAEGWRLSHQWHIHRKLRAYSVGADATGIDCQAFVQWARAYEKSVEAMGSTDLARLPDNVEQQLRKGKGRLPARMVLAGFAETNPQQRGVFDALAARGVLIDTLDARAATATPVTVAALDTHDEIARIADWVSARLRANPQARVGVVVPDLATHKRAIGRALDAVLTPDRLLVSAATRPYNISLGDPLSMQPIVAAQLRLLRLVASDIPFADVSALIRSPFIVGGLVERDARHRLDAAVRRVIGTSVSLQRLMAVVAACSEREAGSTFPQFAEMLSRMLQFKRLRFEGRLRPSEWAARIAELMQIAGIPAGSVSRPLDSAEFQALARWRELLAELASLDRVLPRMRPDRAVEQCKHLADQTIFQPESADAPVQILGVLESNGLVFDHLWVAGLTDAAWPPAAHPHPLLPTELQRTAGMPGASASGELARARRVIDEWSHSAGELVLSHATRDGDRVLAASSVITSFKSMHAQVPRAARLLDAMRAAPLERTQDALAPAWIAGSALPAGAAVLQDQAACPFRAYGRHRLGARALEPPHIAFDARARGSLVHSVLAQFWSGLADRTRAVLASLSAEQRRNRLLQAANEAVQLQLRRSARAVSTALAGLEVERLVRVVDEWIEHELASRHADFRAIAIEDKRAITIGVLALNVQLDRVDEADDGARLIVDYKTGKKAGTPRWFGERPDEPQLPLYLIAAEPGARGIAFARVRAGEPRLVACTDGSITLPLDNRRAEIAGLDWDELTAGWRRVLLSLANAFARGEADVSPKRGKQTCDECDLHTLCRIAERGDVERLAAHVSIDDDDD